MSVVPSIRLSVCLSVPHCWFVWSPLSHWMKAPGRFGETFCMFYDNKVVANQLISLSGTSFCVPACERQTSRRNVSSFKIFQNFTVFWLPMSSGPPDHFVSSVRLIICVIKSCVQKYEINKETLIKVSIKIHRKQECIPVGCVPPARRPYLPACCARGGVYLV